MGSKIKVLIAQGLDVPNFFKNVPKFFKRCTKFAKVRSEVRNDLQSLPEELQMKKWTIGREIGVLLA